MQSTSPPLLVTIIGWIVIVSIPVSFFAFGWKDFELDCQRTTAGGLPACSIKESFALGLYTRHISADNIMRIGYRTGTARQTSTRNGIVTMHPSTMIFDTTYGVVPIGHAISNIDNSAERTLILKTRAFLNNQNAMTFQHTAHIHSLFGYVGLVGVTGLLLIFLAVLWHHLRKIISP